MCNTIISKVMSNRKQGGYTLIEIAMVMMFVGIVMVPAFHLYSQKLETDKRTETDQSVRLAENFVAAFRTMYGRYPCPAPMDASPGDADYGYEDCTAAIPGIVTVASNNPALAATPDVLIGTLPFREMNMQEHESYDGYGNRLTYAVTRILTDSTTFDPNIGGVSVVDFNGNNTLAQPNSAQFVLLSHGKDGRGAITRDGVRSGVCVVGAVDEENCNDDVTFMKSDARVGYDDLMIHATNALIGYWKYTSTTSENVILGDATQFGIGIQNPVELANPSELTVLDSTPSDAIILADGGSMISNEICDYGDTDCFSASLIAGDIGMGTGGMTCPAGQIMTGIELGGPRCVSSVNFECPPGQFMAGVDGDGELICEGAPAPGCPATTMATSCPGPDQPLSGWAGGSAFDGEWDEIRSGDCYMLDNFSAATAGSQPTAAAVQTYIDGLNTAARTPNDCGSHELVRDGYECRAGTWTLINSHELYNYNGSYPGNFYQTGSRLAEVTATPYSIGAGLNSNDCWCREEYRVVLSACPSSGTGNRVRVQKHRCPQTRGQWQTIYDDSTTYCSCAPYSTNSNQSCTSYYGVPGGSMSGNVTTTYNNTCDGSGNIVPDPSPTVDTSACICPARNPAITTVNCPAGETNSFSYDSVNYTAVAEVRENVWTCPAGDNQPVSGPGDAGSWSGYTTVHTEPCACVPFTGNVNLACPAGYSGPGRTYQRDWDCVAGDWEPQAGWTLISDACAACTWKRPATPPSSASTGVGNEIGSGSCSCGATDLCYERVGSSAYDNFTNCRCEP
jgi:type II secretory pathway pseudopilin PulG